MLHANVWPAYVCLVDRFVFGRTSLRPTTAYCLLRHACIQPGDVVVDTCAGSGTIPIEGAIMHPRSLFLAGDNDALMVQDTALPNAHHAFSQAGGGLGQQVQAEDQETTEELPLLPPPPPPPQQPVTRVAPCQDEVDYCGNGHDGRATTCSRTLLSSAHLDLLVWSARQLPLRSASVDKVITGQCAAGPSRAHRWFARLCLCCAAVVALASLWMHARDQPCSGCIYHLSVCGCDCLCVRARASVASNV